mmetsp:Transcript_6498/g.26790  ORF Transcript_6498/g.26790 Transcript_6498/m.26790 type:complete len:767 (-) Transcript_6498:51-2351(-)
MEELRALQAQFQVLQKQAAAQKLSDRVCVEILMKLLQRDLIQIYYTIDGKEYVTPKQLRREIEDELLAHGGRVKLTELQPMLNVDLTHIETHAHALCASDKSVQYISGELVCDWYLDRVAEEVEESLQDAGHLHISTLASRFALSSDVLTEVIERRLATPSADGDDSAQKRRRRREIIHGRLEAPLLYTDAFVEQHTAVLRGLFSAVTVPTPIAALSKMYEFHQSLFFTILVELINSGRLSGSVQGRLDNAQFVPAVFTYQRTQYIERFFGQNGYIEYNVLLQFQISDPAKYLKQHFSDGLALESCFVSATEQLKVDACVAEALEQGEWIDVTPIVPSPLSMTDVREMVRNCACLQKAGGPTFVHLCDSFIVSGTFMNTLLAKFRSHYDEWAAQNTKKLLTSSTEQLRASSESLPTDDGDDDDDDDWANAGKKGKGKKGRRRKGKAAGKGKGKGKGKAAASGGSSGAVDTESFDRENLTCLQRWHPELPEELTEALVEEMRSKLMALRDEASRVVFLGSDAKKKYSGTDWQEGLHTLHWNVELFHRCAHEHHDDSAFMEKHLLKSLCADAVNMLLEANASHYFVELEGPVLKAGDRAKALKLLKGKPIHEAMVVLDAALGSSVDDFLDALWDVTEQMDIRLKKLDKRSQSNLVEVHKKSLREQLMEEQNPSHAYHLAVLVMYAKAHHMVLHVPGKLILNVLERVRGVVHESVFERLHEFGTRTRAYLAAKAKKEPHDELLKELEEKLPDLKAAVEEEMDRPAPKKE